MFEVEQKFHLDDSTATEAKLVKIGFQAIETQTHRDTYYNHPCRDFAESKEALRVRRINGVPRITYKGTKLPGAIKARRELEWELGPGDADGEKTEALLQLLGFQRVAEVCKARSVFEPVLVDPEKSSLEAGLGDLDGFSVVLDEVQQVGRFAEIELIVKHESDVEQARDRIGRLAERLGLQRSESRSYLRMLLEVSAGNRIGQ
ncbi:adenylyl cyclase related protein [Rhodopirellula maiorica SM1]|uniref:Adenylyl cyclase related protein n=1 Tax=Rhodopirellula maiorica SM1 TaxID=1265738 RepID=M5S7D5_9BACT|nr:class IV adenylate cyclase [Rhodopirellula maiorica]EMI22099.1 adenylyl cyclase related protein [Rhodopirellula maiorica SM1]